MFFLHSVIKDVSLLLTVIFRKKETWKPTYVDVAGLPEIGSQMAVSQGDMLTEIFLVVTITFNPDSHL